jgi:integrative and conjugative element protein (TIGR02256 family)
MNGLSWITLYPELYREERHLIESQYPEMKFCEAAYQRGVLRYHGKIPVHDSDGVTKHNVLLTYSSLFPYRAPVIVPIEELPGEEPHSSWKIRIIMTSARHQMANGNLCLVETDPFSENPDIIRGVDMLRRARSWFFGIKSGHNPYDSIEADLQAHLNRSGDILIGSEFFSDELSKGGYFYGVRLLDMQERASARVVGIALSSDFEEIAKFKDCRNSLKKPFPWVDQKIWDAARQWAEGRDGFREAIEANIVIRGPWWDLDFEPPPPKTGGDIVRLVCDPTDTESLRRTLDAFKGDISIETHIFAGLRFPDRRGGYDWLFLLIDLRPRRVHTPEILGPETKLSLLERSQVLCLYRHPLLPRELTLRNTGRVPVEIARRRIALLGAGAIGSVMADLFVKAGISAIGLYDKDIIQVGNVSRHLCGIESFGESKVDTVGLRLIQHNPFTKIDTRMIDLSNSFDTIKETIAGCDLAVSTLADESLESAVNEVAVTMPQVVYYIRGMRGATSGRIFRVIPGRDACKHCISHLINGSNSDPQLSEWLRVPEIGGTLLSHECGDPVLAGSGIDLTLIASLAARIILNDIGSGATQENHWLWTSESISDHPELREPFRLIARRVEPDPNCPVCSDPPIQRIQIPSHVLARMEETALATGERETGGVFIGHFNENRTAMVVDASDAGPNAESSVSGFSRDVEYTQRWLEERIRGFRGEVEYIGEWHSHPTENTAPSSVDTTSLIDIANSPNYLCRTPVMLILGCSEGAVKSRSAYGFAANRPFRQIDLEVTDNNSLTGYAADAP